MSIDYFFFRIINLFYFSKVNIAQKIIVYEIIWHEVRQRKFNRRTRILKVLWISLYISVHTIFVVHLKIQEVFISFIICLIIRLKKLFLILFGYMHLLNENLLWFYNRGWLLRNKWIISLFLFDILISRRF